MWLLIDFQCSVEALGETIYFLEYGESVKRKTFKSALSIWETDKAVYVSTGAINLTVDKTTGVLKDIYIDSNGDKKPDLLAAKECYFRIESENGEVYLSKLEKPSVEVESSGPLQAVVKIKGSHKSVNGNYLLNYTLRLYFYAGKSYIKTFYTEENDLPCLNNGAGQPDCLRLGSPNSIYFKDLSLILSIPEVLRRFTAPLNKGIIDSDFNEKVLVYQDSNSGDDWKRWPGVSFKGFKLYIDGVKKYSGNRFKGWLDVKSLNVGVAVGVKYFWQNYPKAIEVDASGNVYVRLMPKYFSQLFEHRAGEHKTHEIILYLHSASESSDEISKLMESLLNPLYARAPAKWYMYSGVFEYFEPYDPENFKYYEINNLGAVNGTGAIMVITSLT